jgi:hypothetical protein
VSSRSGLEDKSVKGEKESVFNIKALKDKTIKETKGSVSKKRS